MTCGRIKVHIAFWTPVRKAKTDRLLTAVGCAIHADHSAARQIGRDALQNRSRRNPAPGVSIQIKQAVVCAPWPKADAFLPDAVESLPTVMEPSGPLRTPQPILPLPLPLLPLSSP